ncbi:MAG: HEPN domain-containing protein [Paraglaciecola chathamensis]
MTKAKKEFEIGISDAQDLITYYDELNGVKDRSHPPEVLKRAALIMALTAWETYVEDVAAELINEKYGMVMGSQLGNIVQRKLNDHLKVFNNPDSKKTKDLFLEFFGFDVTESWVWGNYQTAQDSRAALNKWLKKRGEAVHRTQINKQNPHIVKRDELDKCLRFFKELVDITDKSLSAI